jgi:hypothetical protein
MIVIFISTFIRPDATCQPTAAAVAQLNFSAQGPAVTFASTRLALPRAAAWIGVSRSVIGSCLEDKSSATLAPVDAGFEG